MTKGINFTKVGHDFGVKPYYMLVGDMEFSHLFQKANCNGVLYVFEENDSNEKIPVQMAFVFQNEKPAKRFLDILLGWIDAAGGNGDTVSISFIENKKGGYTIGISHDMGSFVDKMLPKELKDKVHPLMVLGNHYKEIDSISPSYSNFRMNYMKSDGIAVGYVIGDARDLNNVKPSGKYFIKKKFLFPQYNDIEALTYKATQEEVDLKDEKKYPRPPKESIEDISKNRLKEILNYLPITSDKLNKLWLNDVINELTPQFSIDLIKQAICNLIIIERIKKNADFCRNIKKLNSSTLLEYLVFNFESFDSYFPLDHFFRKGKILRQMQNDKKELNAHLKR